jgi:hypothetical protein
MHTVTKRPIGGAVQRPIPHRLPLISPSWLRSFSSFSLFFVFTNKLSSVLVFSINSFNLLNLLHWRPTWGSNCETREFCENRFGKGRRSQASGGIGPRSRA